MKIKLANIWTGQKALSNLFDAKLPNAKASYWIGKIAKRLQAELKEVDKQRREIGLKHGDEKDDGTINFEGKKGKEFLKEFEDFLETEIEIENITPLLFNWVKPANLTPNDYAALDWLIQEPSDIDEGEKK